MDDLYAILGVRPEADPEVIRSAYQALLAKHDPDLAPGEQKEAVRDRRRSIDAAYAVLRDPGRRAQYDRERRSPRQPPSATPPPPSTADWCPKHPGTRATARCDHCLRWICPECAKKVGELTVCETCLQKDEALPRFARGQAALEAGGFQQAATAFREVLLLQPEDPNTLYNLGLALMGLGLHREALEKLAQAVDLQPMSSDVHIAHAQALSATGELEEAVRAYRRGLSIAPDNSEAAHEVGVLLARLGSYRDAYTVFDEVAKREWSNPRGLVMQAKMLLALGRGRKAYDLMARALEINPAAGSRLREFPLGFRVRFFFWRFFPFHRRR